MCGFHKTFVVISVLLFLLIFLSNTQAAPKYLYHFCTDPTYTPNSTYQANLNTVLSSLSSNSTRNKGFYNSSYGSDRPNIAYGVSLCRGDVTSDVCRDCVSTATKEIVTRDRCPNQKVAVIWYVECMVRYADRSIFSVMDDDPRTNLLNTGNISEIDQTRFQKVLDDTFNFLATRASNSSNGGQYIKGYATGSTNLTSRERLYELVQCTPDLSARDCNACLLVAIAALPQCCYGKVGGTVLIPSCNIRYEMYPFYSNRDTTTLPSPGLIPLLPPPSSLTRPKGNGGISSKPVAVIVPICVALVLFSIGSCFIIRKARRKGVVTQQETDRAGDEITTVESLQFDLSTIETATNNFSADNKIGQGGFGEVFKGVLANGQEIAVKRLSKSSGQGAEEFKNEVVLVAKLQHRNLVRLLGFCLHGQEKILIYEYIPNKSLDCFLFDPKRQRQLYWLRRYKIIVGIARGMVYLHEDSRLRIIHRDLKASNILLDEDMNPKVSDFGMARIFSVDQTHGNTSRIVGTYGYMSPEYAMHGQFSVKSDVFSFGVLVLEIISGKKNTNFYQSDRAEDLLGYAWKHWRDSTPLELVDPSLADSYSRNEVLRCINIGLLCVQEDVDARPSMATVLLMLRSHSVTISRPQQPPFFFPSRPESKTPEGFKSDQSTSNSMPWSVDEASITGVYPR